MHWANRKTLLPVWEVPKKAGGYTNRISLEAAAREDLIPRVTGVIEDMIGYGYGLQQYLKRTVALAAERAVRKDDETDKAYVSRIIELAGEEARAARDRGKEVHSRVEQYLRGGQLPEDSASADIGLQITAMRDACRPAYVEPEKHLSNDECSGTADLVMSGVEDISAAYKLCVNAVPRTLGGSRVLMDLKTRVLKQDSKPYRTDLYQLGAYAWLEGLEDGDLMVLAVGDYRTGIVKFFAETEVERWKQAFIGLWQAWKLENNWEALRVKGDFWAMYR